MSPSRRYAPIDEALAQRIRELHREHPNLGHHGLLEALRDEGTVVDPRELERFMEREDIEGESWVHIPNTIKGFWRSVGLRLPGGREESRE